MDARHDRRRAGRHGHLRLSGGRILAGLELAPHRVRGWLNRRDDEQFWAQAAAVCEVYLRPPPGTVVICIDEKTGLQAKSRKYAEQPPRPGRLARRESGYVRNGTVSIIAALHVATGQVVTEPIEQTTRSTFTGFLHRLDQCIDPRLNIHLVMDNGPSHTSRATRAWIAAHPRITVTYTPKHASWLDMAELWFSVLARRLLRCGEFTSRADLADPAGKITDFAIRCNRTARPFTWSYDARADHARHLARRTSQHPASTTEPATVQTLPQAA